MQETQAKAIELTNQGEGKHHIGDFLPPDELARFMEKVQTPKYTSNIDIYAVISFYFITTCKSVVLFVSKVHM